MYGCVRKNNLSNPPYNPWFGSEHCDVIAGNGYRYMCGLVHVFA